MNHLLQLTDGCLMIDNSSISVFFECPRQSEYKLVAKRQLKKKRIALDFGRALHKALEVRGLWPSAHVTPELEQEQVRVLAEEFKTIDVEPEEYRTLDYAIETIQKYNTHYKIDTLKPITLLDGKPAVEVPFALPIGIIDFEEPLQVLNNGIPAHVTQIQIIFTGKIDRIVEHNNMLLLLDHKSSSIGGSGFFEEFYTSMQFKGYRWAGEQLIGRRIGGVIIDGLIVRAPLKSKGMAWNGEFLRDTIYYHDSHIEEWKTSIQHSIGDFLHSYRRQYFPLHTMWCKGKYGLCDFYNVCQLPVDSRLGMLDSALYADVTWTPLQEKQQHPQKTEIALP